MHVTFPTDEELMLKTGCCALLLLSGLSMPASASMPSIKVLIGKSLKNIRVEGTDLRKIVHTQNKSLQYLGRKQISFNCDPAKSVKAIKFPEKALHVASLNSPTGLVSWNDKKYQGEFHLVTSPKKQSCDLINLIPMESYITSLLAKEMNGTWPIEALKAQAVAARTYALHRIKNFNQPGLESHDTIYHLESSEKDQVSGTYFDATPLTVQAAKETEGMVLLPKSGKLSQIFFHSKCGGRTFRPDQVWGGVEEGYRQVDCPFCHKLGTKDWKKKVSRYKLTQLVDRALQKYYADKIVSSDVRFLPDRADASEVRLYDGDRFLMVKKAYLRNMSGREMLPSNYFAVSDNSRGVNIDGQGYGHGVGLCQLGALELAKRGYDYKQILSFYFPQHHLDKAY